MPKIYEIYGEDPVYMTMELMKAAKVEEALKPGMRVALKPNLLAPISPELGATTHPGVVEGCIRYLRDHGITDIYVIESSWLGARTQDSVQNIGIDEVCGRYQVPFFDLKKDETTLVNTPYRDIEVCKKALDTDYLINLPVLKGHCQTRLTCALKNMKGCIPDREKRKFHTEGLMKPIAGLACAIRPDLTIVDSICGDLNFEEGGNPVRTNRMMLGTDPVQLDAYGCRLLGIPIEEVSYIGMAERFGAGTTTVDDEDIIALNRPEESAAYTADRGLVKKLAKNVHADQACSVCYASLIRALYELQEDGIPAPDDIYIGQGWKNKSITGVGVGACCRGSNIYVKGCPPSAAEIKRVLQEERNRRHFK